MLPPGQSLMKAFSTLRQSDVLDARRKFALSFSANILNQEFNMLRDVPTLSSCYCGFCTTGYKNTK